MKKIISHGTKFSKSYAYIRSLKNAFTESSKYLYEKSLNHIVIKLKPEGASTGKVLFSYIINGFLLKSGDPISSRHTNIWQSVKMAETFVELGYEVDVIHYKNNSFIPKDKYSAMVDVRHNMARFSDHLNKDCIKIPHLDTSHILFHNAAEARRLLELQTRRGITLPAHRYEPPNKLIDLADYATTVGNDACINTYKYANKKIYKLPTPCAITFPWDETKDWGNIRNHFLWFSSSGFVHKGLDLVLDAFRELSDYHLTICAPLDKDKDFIYAYNDELFKSPNINTVGCVDIEGDQFKNITSSCVAMIHTSCSEAGTGSTKTCMHAGLIPIVSYETATDVKDFGLTLKNSSIDEIKNAVKFIANLPTNELKDRSYKAWEYARTHHTREIFAEKYKEVISHIMSINK